MKEKYKGKHSLHASLLVILFLDILSYAVLPQALLRLFLFLAFAASVLLLQQKSVSGILTSVPYMEPPLY
jgi:hypothetical protein